MALIGDRGMITSARIGEELKPMGLDWISCLKAPQIAVLAADTGPLQLTLFGERDLAEITSPEFPGERLIACRNPLLAAERARKREELLAATQRQLQRIAEAVRKKPAKHDAAKIDLAVGAVIDKWKMKKHFELDIADGRFAFMRRVEEIEAEARLDGIYVIRTRTRTSIVWPAEPSAATTAKRTKREAVDGTPIMAWHDLVANLGTLTINEVALPLDETRTFQMLARPTALHE